MQKRQFEIGIDEAGRGPLAGPVSVGVVLARKDFDFGIFPHLADSKKMTEKRREKVVRILKEVEEGSSDISSRVVFSSAKNIDADGITNAIQAAIDSGLNQLSSEPDDMDVYLDGGLSAPDQYIHQESITGGDGKMPVISLASVIAKVARDNVMKQYDKKFPEYNLAQHKGYGTKEHRDLIKKHGASKIHRKSFLKNIL